MNRTIPILAGERRWGLAAVRAHFPPNGVIPPENFFLKPQYNTWAELIYDQNQENILSHTHLEAAVSGSLTIKAIPHNSRQLP